MIKKWNQADDKKALRKTIIMIIVIIIVFVLFIIFIGSPIIEYVNSTLPQNSTNFLM